MEATEFIQYFREELFIGDLKSTKKADALREMVRILCKQQNIKNAEIILEMLYRREDLGSTGIGNGVAIPHGRTLAVPDTVVVFGRSKEGIEFDAIDGEPVHLIFLIVAPPHDESNVYLPLLGKIVEIVREEDNRKRLLDAETYEEFIDALLRGLSNE